MKRFKYMTLAALVAFAACDEATEVVVPPPVTGTISGVVTIEGVGASGMARPWRRLASFVRECGRWRAAS